MLSFITKYIITLRYVKLISYILAKYLQESRQESHKHRYTYYYGWQIIIGAINKGLLLILLGLAFNILPQLLIITISFASIRIFVGGLHFDSYTKCAYISLLIFITSAYFAKYIYIPNPIIILIYLTNFILFFIYAPIEHQNNPLKENKKIKFKIISLVLLLINFMIVANLDSVIITNSIVYGVLLSGIITIPFISKLK